MYIWPSTFVPITWVCKKHGAVSHSSTEAEVIALDAALRLEGLPALMLWDTVIDVLDSARDDPSKKPCASDNRSQRRPTQKLGGALNVSGVVSHNCSCPSFVSDIDFVPPSANLSSGSARLFLFEDNEAVIKMCLKGRSPILRHISRTHRVDLDWLIERIKVDPGIKIKFVGTDQQMADMMTKASFTIPKMERPIEIT